MREIVGTAAYLLLPGALCIIQKKILPKLTFVEKIPLGIIGSFAWWITGFWFLRIVPISLSAFITVSFIFSVLLLALRFSRGSFSFGPARTNLTAFLFFALILIPLSPLFHATVPPGKDMSMHGYMATVIRNKNGFPVSMRPLAPVDHFGFYPVGLPVLAAGLSEVNALPISANLVLLDLCTLWLFAAMLYVLLRIRWPVLPSMLAAALVTWANTVPMAILSWGAAPTVLSFVFLFSAFTVPLPFSFALIFASFLTHYIIPVAAVYFGIPLLFLFWNPIRSQIKAYIRSPKPLAIFLITIPLLWHVRNFSFRVTPAVARYVSGLQQADLTAYTGAPGWNILLASIRFLETNFSHPIFALYGLAVLTILILGNWRHLVWQAVLLLVLLALIMNSRYFVLPFSLLLYPDRIVLFGILPAAFGIAEGATVFLRETYASVIRHTQKNNLLLHAVFVSVIAYMVLPVLRVNSRIFTTAVRLTPVTASDLTAMNWIRTHTPPAATIFTNENDAGIWIPAIAERAATSYQTNPIDMMARMPLPAPSYAFSGSRTLTENGLDPVMVSVREHPGNYRLVFSQGNAKVYRVLPEQTTN